MSTPPSATVPMLSPDGKVADIPVDRAPEAAKAGWKQGVDMVGPDGKSISTIPVDRAEEAQKAGFKVPNNHLLQMKPNYTALIPTQLPSGADPHNPGNPNLNAVPESERANVNDAAMNTAIATTPMEALIAPGLGAAKVSQARQAGKFVAGKVTEEGTLAGDLAGAAKKGINITEDMLEKFGSSYPELTKLAKALGSTTGAAGGALTAYEIFKKLHEK